MINSTNTPTQDQENEFDKFDHNTDDKIRIFNRSPSNCLHKARVILTAYTKEELF